MLYAAGFDFFKIATAFAAVDRSIEDAAVQGGPMSAVPPAPPHVLKGLRDLLTADSLQRMPMVGRQLERMCEVLARPSTLGEWRNGWTALRDRFEDESRGLMFFPIKPSREKLCLMTSAFGAGVEAKFPQMVEDIAEASKCLALERSTAAVFHLMRVMELAVQAFGGKLGVELASEQNWQVILDQINSAIRSKDKKVPETKKYSEAAAHLYSVKVAWRNEVMHPKQTYTAEEAEMIYANVKVFLNELVDLV